MERSGRYMNRERSLLAAVQLLFLLAISGTKLVSASKTVLNLPSDAAARRNSLHRRPTAFNPSHPPEIKQRRHQQQRHNKKSEPDNVFTTAPKSFLPRDVRGGSSSAALLPSPPASPAKTLFGILFWIVLDVSLRQVFSSCGITFPSMMAACIGMFVVMAGAEVLKKGWGDAIFNVIGPGADLLSRWVSVFFVPGVIMLPTAPKISSSLELMKIASVIILGFLFSLLTTCYSVIFVRTIQGQISTSDTATTSSEAPKPYSTEILQYLTTGALLFFPISIHATRTSHSKLSTPLQTAFMLCTSLSSFVYGSRLPRSIIKMIHPLVIATTATLSATYLTGRLTGRSFMDTLLTYKTGTLTPFGAGAGDILLFMLGPAVCSLSTAMYSRKTLMYENLLVVLLSTAVSALGGLFGTALYVRLISLSSGVLRRSVLTRNVTTALAMATTQVLNGNTAVSACVVVITGIIGATYGASFLSMMGIRDPVARGLGIGAAAQGLGAASMVGEKDAFPFAAINMIMTAVVVSALVNVGSVRDFVLRLALGDME